MRSFTPCVISCFCHGMLCGIDWQLVTDVSGPIAYQSTMYNKKPSFRLDYKPCFMTCEMVTAELMHIQVLNC